MQFGDREKKFLIWFASVVIIGLLAYFGAYEGGQPPPLPPVPEQYGAESIPSQPGPPGDFVSKSYGGQYDDAVKFAIPTANATADAGVYINNLSLAESLRVEEAGTPTFVVRNGGGLVGAVRYETAGQTLVCGTTTITGTGTLAHGLTTPAYCMTGLKGDFAADTGFTSCAISGSTVTGKVWKVNSTPTAGSVGVVVAWCVIGTP